MKHCPECGNKLNPEDKFCRKCGYKIQLENKQTEEKIKESKPKGKRRSKLAIIVIAVVVVGILLLLIFSPRGGFNSGSSNCNSASMRDVYCQSCKDVNDCTNACYQYAQRESGTNKITITYSNGYTKTRNIIFTDVYCNCDYTYGC